MIQLSNPSCVTAQHDAEQSVRPRARGSAGDRRGEWHRACHRAGAGRRRRADGHRRGEQGHGRGRRRRLGAADARNPVGRRPRAARGLRCAAGARTRDARTGDAFRDERRTAKAALAMLVKELAKTLGRFNIRVNALVPGAIAAGGFVADPALARHIPLGRLGQANDLAPLALAVLSNRISAYVTGAAIVIDGGLSLTNWFEPPELSEL